MPADTSKKSRRADQEIGGWRQSLVVYRDRRMAVIFLMGFSSGLPLLLTLSTLGYWLAKVGVDKTSIGLFALVGLPYSLKFLWAPVIDQVRVPWLARRIGHRRAWALVTQVGLIAAILVLGTTDPAIDPWSTALAAMVVAFLSASQDIVIDAYRIEILSDREQGAGAASTQVGYRIGLLVAGAGVYTLSDWIGWFWIFTVLALFVLVGVVGVILAEEPSHPVDRSRETPRDAAAWVRHAVVEPLTDFMRRPSWLAILVFAMFYKFGDAIGGVMANPFYIELGFSGTEIGVVSKVLGLLATFLGVFLGGLLVARYGIFRALLVGGVLQAVTNLLFALQAAIGHNIFMLAVAISADNVTGGLGSAALVAYLSSLCNARFTGTQYALLTSLMAVGRTVLSAGGGWLADQVDWVTFFAATTLLALPGLALLLWLMRIYAEPAASASMERQGS